jgi:hypothetical protein
MPDGDEKEKADQNSGRYDDPSFFHLPDNPPAPVGSWPDEAWIC